MGSGNREKRATAKGGEAALLIPGPEYRYPACPSEWTIVDAMPLSHIMLLRLDVDARPEAAGGDGKNIRGVAYSSFSLSCFGWWLRFACSPS
jgi:hypothetical protein